MITVFQALERVINEQPLYGEAILSDIVNVSALARRLKPDVEEVLLEPISDGAMTIALKRYASVLRKTRKPLEHSYPIRNFSLRSDLTVLVYQNSPGLEVVHRHLLLSSQNSEDAFLHFAQGSQESSFVLSDELVPEVKKLTRGEKLISEFPRLSAVSVRMAPEVMQLPGVFAPFVQALAWQKISICQMMSHFTEVTFVVADDDAERAFAGMKTLAKKK